jgi:hypothetical protein
MISSVEFDINPRLYISPNKPSNDNSVKTMRFNNKNLNPKIKEIIIKDMVSNKFKKYLYKIIFDIENSDEISNYLDGKIKAITYNKNNFNFRVKIDLFLYKKILNDKTKKLVSDKTKKLVSDKTKKLVSDKTKKLVSDKTKILKLITKNNIKNLIKENINHIYRSRGHYKTFKVGDNNITISFETLQPNDNYVMNKFSFTK